MLELGDHGELLHQQVGEAAVKAGVDQLVTIGGHNAVAVAVAAIMAGLPRAQAHYFKTSDEAERAFASYVRDGDLVLVKGSRGIRTDRVVDRLKTAWGG
jgi:UDP-N-acetylmuramoyl-tripeptide--D-alanyl-D-alanine ligase